MHHALVVLPGHILWNISQIINIPRIQFYYGGNTIISGNSTCIVHAQVRGIGDRPEHESTASSANLKNALLLRRRSTPLYTKTDTHSSAYIAVYFTYLIQRNVAEVSCTEEVVGLLRLISFAMLSRGLYPWSSHTALSWINKDETSKTVYSFKQTSLSTHTSF